MNIEDYFIRDNWHPWNELPGDKEIHNEPTLTVPKLSIPLEDLLTRSVVPSLPALYEGYTGLPDVRTMDKIEREEFRREVHASIKHSQEQLQAHNQKLNEEKLELEKQEIAQMREKLSNYEKNDNSNTAE